MPKDIAEVMENNPNLTAREAQTLLDEEAAADEQWQPEPLDDDGEAAEREIATEEDGDDDL